MITGVREPRAAKQRTEQTKSRPVPSSHTSPLQKVKMKENRDDPRSRVKRRLFDPDLAINNTPDRTVRPGGLQLRGNEEKSNSAPRSVFEGGNSGSRDRDNFSRLLFHVKPSSRRSPHSESRKELALKSSGKRAQPWAPPQNTKYPRKFHPMASSTPEKKKKKEVKEVKEEVTLIRTTWTLRKSHWNTKTKPDKNKQIDLNLCWVSGEEEDDDDDDGDDDDDDDGGHDYAMYLN